jgi:hypothetical protein
MALQTHFRCQLYALAPGTEVAIRQQSDGSLIEQVTIGPSGAHEVTYLASRGACYAEALPPGLSTWSAFAQVTPGEEFMHDAFAGRRLRCVISGQTGATRPTNDNRLWGQYHHNTAHDAYSLVVRSRNKMYSYGYASRMTNSTSDKYPTKAGVEWPAERIIELDASYYSIYALLDDGTVMFNQNASSSSPNMVRTWAFTQALTGIVKLWAWRYGCFFRNTSGDLLHIVDYQESTHRPAIDTLLAANPTAVAPFHSGGIDGEDNCLILADGTIASGAGIDATRAAYNATLGDIEAGAMDSSHNIIALGENATRVRGDMEHSSQPFDWTCNTGDEVALVDCEFRTAWCQTRQGQGQVWSNVTYNMPNNYYLACGLGRPEQMLIEASALAMSTQTIGNTALHPYGFARAQKTNTLDDPAFVDLDPTTDAMLSVQANAIVQDGAAVFHLIDTLQTRIPLHNMETVDIDVQSTSGDGIVSGTVTVNGQSAERPVIAISRDPVGEGRIVLAETVSASDGTFSLTAPGYTDPLMVLALDNAGERWSGLANIAFGARTFPSADNHTGLVYECIVAGTAAASEPTWPSAIGETVADGSVTWKAIEYYQPQAHGPINPLVTGA